MGTAKRERQKANRQKRLEELAAEARREKTKKRFLTWGIAVAAALILLFVVAQFVGGDDESSDATTTTAAPSTTVETSTTTTAGPTTTVARAFEYGTAPCPAEDGSSELPETFEGAPEQCIEDGVSYLADVVTNKGSFTIELAADTSPGNVNNFVTLARYGYYEGAVCHRVITDFVVQCGLVGDDETKPGYSVPDELPGPDAYAEAVVAVANTGQPDSGGGQWFIITGENGANLPPSYSVLGTVTAGYDTTVRALENLADPLASNGVPPLAEIVIESITIRTA